MRTAAWAVEDCVRRWSSKMEDIPTWVLLRGHFICSDGKGGHSLSVCAVGCGPPFVAPAVALVSAGKCPWITDKPYNRR